MAGARAREYRKIKRPFPPTARAHPAAPPAPLGTTTRRASTREAAWAWQAVRKLATKSCELRPQGRRERPLGSHGRQGVEEGEQTLCSMLMHLAARIFRCV